MATILLIERVAEEEVAVDAGAELADVAGAQEQLVAGDFGVGGGFAEGGNEELGPAVHGGELLSRPFDQRASVSGDWCSRHSIGRPGFRGELPGDPDSKKSDQQRGLIRADGQALQAGGDSPEPVQAAVADIGTRESRLAKVGAAQVAVAEDGSGEIGVVQIGIGEVALLEDAVDELPHAKQGEVELALEEEHVFELHLREGCAGEPRARDLDPLKPATREVDIGEIGALNLCVFDAEVGRFGVRQCYVAEQGSLDAKGLATRAQYCGKSHTYDKRIVQDALGEQRLEVFGEEIEVKLRCDAAFGLGRHALRIGEGRRSGKEGPLW